MSEWECMKEYLDKEHRAKLKKEFSSPPFNWKPYWKFCPTCKRPYIECPLCGNNCCNGGSGTVDGEQCIVCDFAYEEQSRVFRLIPEELNKHIYFIPDPRALPENKELLTTHNNMLGQFYHDMMIVVDKFIGYNLEKSLADAISAFEHILGPEDTIKPRFLLKGEEKNV